MERFLEWTAAVMLFACSLVLIVICLVAYMDVRDKSIKAKIESCKVGQFCELNGHGFLKTRGAK